MVLPESIHFQPSSKRTVLHKASSLIADGFLFVGGAFLAIFLIWVLLSCISPNTSYETTAKTTDPLRNDGVNPSGVNSDAYPSETTTFYDDPSLVSQSRVRLRAGTRSESSGSKKPGIGLGDRVILLLMSGSQLTARLNPVGDHLILRLCKKVDYRRNVLLHRRMTGFWAKYAVVKAAMLAHPEAEWIWWVDSDAVFTDMEFHCRESSRISPLLPLMGEISRATKKGLG